MKHFFTLFVCMGAIMSVEAQTGVSDTDQSHELQEIVIEAPKVVRKSDMDVYHPSRSAVEASKNGLQLISNLMIPALTVSDALGTIQAAGEGVQVRINGRESTLDQVRALLPETIKRVEWIDNPGLRYGGAAYVLNVIVSNPTVGGSVQTMSRQALNSAFGFYMADAKFNTGYSQWEVGANYKMANRLKTHREYAETFTYPDGSSLTRNEQSLGGSMSDSRGMVWASYNFIKPDTTVLMVDLGFHHSFNNNNIFRGLMSLSDGNDDIVLNEATGSDGSYPSLSIYWEQNLKNRQVVVFNASSSFNIGKTYSDYIEHAVQGDGLLSPITDISTDIRDRNGVYALEGDYIKHWAKSRLTVGASYTANRNRSKYNNLGGRVFHQRQDRVYLFAEYFQRFGNWTATAGMGVQYTDYLFKETDEGNHTWSVRPQATVTYSVNQNHNLRLSFSSWQSTPTLAQTNIVPQQLDGFQWRVGNQSLQTSNSYMLTMRYGFNFKRMNGMFGVRAFTSPNAITPLLYWHDARLITTYENSRGLKNLSFFAAPQIDVIPDWISISGYLQYRMERMRGTGYAINHNGWSGNFALSVRHWGFELTGQSVYAQRDLWGETISWGENLNLIDLRYNLKEWQFSAGIIMPFGKYDQGSKSLSKWNRNEQHTRLDMRMPYVSVSYNVQWGRQKRGAQKLIDVDANADRSTAGGR